MNILKKNPDWLVDDTFSIAPKVYTQLFSFHTHFHGKSLPLIYCLLPGKEKRLYIKLFNLLNYHLDPADHPKTINCDFEKAIHSAIQTVYINCCISGCFFHLCQSWLKRLKKLKLYLVYLKDKDFSKAFKMCQALAYIPESEVQEGLDEIKVICSSSFKLMIDYIQNTYVMPVAKSGKKQRNARFPVSSWSVYQRTLDDKPATNNPVESWHSSLTVILKFVSSQVGH